MNTTFYKAAYRGALVAAALTIGGYFLHRLMEGASDHATGSSSLSFNFFLLLVLLNSILGAMIGATISRLTAPVKGRNTSGASQSVTT